MPVPTGVYRVLGRPGRPCRATAPSREGRAEPPDPRAYWADVIGFLSEYGLLAPEAPKGESSNEIERAE